jgi:hypothetical protein
MAFSFCASHSTVGPADDEPGVDLKISGSECEMNVCLALAELHLLDRVKSTPWEQGSLKIGTSAHAPVWWSCDDAKVFIAAGVDDQTWFFGVSLSLAQFAELCAAIRDERAISVP